MMAKATHGPTTSANGVSSNAAVYVALVVVCIVLHTHSVAPSVSASNNVCQSYSITNEQYKRMPKNIAVSCCDFKLTPAQFSCLINLYARKPIPTQCTNSAIKKSTS